MATTGSFDLYPYSNGYYNTNIDAGDFSWSLSSQNAEDNSSTFTWSMTGKSPMQEIWYFKGVEIWLVMASGKRYTIHSQTMDAPVEHWMNFNLGSGTFTIQHEDDGSCDFTLYANFYGHLLISTSIITCQGEEAVSFPKINREPTILTASNFTDEENPVITYSNPVSTGTLQACISVDGQNPTLAYRTISAIGTSYTFTLTDTDRNTLRAAAKNAQTLPVTYILKCTVGSTDFYAKATRTFTVVNCNPVISDVSIYDTLHVDLTGSRDILIANDNLVEYSFKTTASKSAEIVKTSIKCGTKTIEDMQQGAIIDAETGTFIISATDSRGLTTTITVTKQVIDYVKPTCYQKVDMEMSGETGAAINLIVNGNYFNGTFGGLTNTLKLEVRYTQPNGELGNWIDLTAQGYTPTYDGNTYRLAVTLEGFSYDQAYVVQSRATDKLNVVVSAQYTAKLLPVFDWSATDFNFNVEVKMNDETVLRHNEDSNNTVLSGSGGSIYLRPGGTNDTYGQVQITPDGNLVVNGGISFGDGTPDFVIEQGTEEMGSNGTWKWFKWYSGRSECYGSRNFGAMAITTTWGNLYRSAAQSQSLPSGLFNTAPDSINIYLKDANYGGWIAKHETSASSSTDTGSFIVVRPASATLSSSHIGFHILGRWK